MEKFSNWRDKGTGISPFMPVAEPSSGVIGYLVGVPKFLVMLLKVPVLVFALAVYYVVPLGALDRLILLVLMGLKRCEFSVEGIKRSRTSEVDAARPRAGEVYVVNFTSPLDGLIVASISQVSWRNILILVPNARGEVFEYSVWSFMGLAFSQHIGEQQSTRRYEESHAKDKLVLYFGEGTPSNNKAVLPFSTSFKSPPGASVGTLVLKIQPPHLTLPLPIKSEISYIVKTLMNTNGNSGIRIKGYKHNNYNLDASRESFMLSGLNSVGKDLSIAAKQKFYDYYLDYKVKKD